VNPGAKLAGFTVVLAAALGGGTALGRAVGPLDVTDDTAHGHGGSPDHGAHTATAPEAPGTPATAAGGVGAGGLAVSQAGYTLAPDRTVLDGAAGAPFTFRITGPDGAVVRDYAATHEREAHLVVVSRDLATYAHLHPTRAADGTWSAPLPALPPGAYRAVADVEVAGGPALALGVDVTVPGDARPAPLPPPAATATATATIDGYQVGMTSDLTPGATGEVALAVSRGGVPVDGLDPYLGEAGHMVAIRAGDLAYLHVHPQGAGDAGGGSRAFAVRFDVEVPSPGDYRLFFEFSHAGAVRTVAYTVHVPAATDPHATMDHSDEEEG
jgi:hypothetical protein